jgi:uncharacterized repeat protein (TIGR04052 family)
MRHLLNRAGFVTALVLALSAALIGCDHDHDDHNHDDHEHDGEDGHSHDGEDGHSHDVSGDVPAGARAVMLHFDATVGDQVAACGVTYRAVGGANASVKLADARLYVSALEARAADGTWTPITLDESAWQSQGVALLDFEDGSDACADSGTPEKNNVITGTLPEGSYDALRFDVGVPFALNHNNLGVPAPLSVPGMFWTWQGGFKFARVDWVPLGGDVARWNVHIGSTECASDAATTPPDAPCGRRNAATITLSTTNLDHGGIHLDLGALLTDVNTNQNTPNSPPGCMSSPGEPNDCAPTFGALGLSFETGACVDGCQGQRVFSIAH